MPPSRPVPIEVTSSTRRSSSQLGVVLMLCGMFLFSATDMIAKLLTEHFHPVQIIWFRQSGLFCGVVGMLCFRGLSVLHSKQPKLQILRGVLVIFSSLLFVFAVQYVALADAVAASFVAPFFLTIAGAVLLKEPVGIRRWSAVAIGFIGAVVIVRPGMGSIHPAAMLVVLAAAFYASRQIIGRLLADTDKTLTTIAYTAIVSSLLVSMPLPFVWQTPTTDTQWLLLLTIAIAGAGGEVLVIKAFEVAEAAVVAPVHYSLIIWGTIYGYFVFHQLPDQWTLIGTAIIVGAGIYTLQRDRVAAQKKRQKTGKPK